MLTTHSSMPGAALRPTVLAGRAWDRLGPGGQLALWLLVGLRIGLELVGVLAVQLQPPTTLAPWAHLRVPDDAPWSLFLGIWQRWDAPWYQQIAEYGYRPGDNTVRFMPLYPLLVRLVWIPLGGHFVWSQLVVSSLAFFAAMWLLYEVARLDVEPSAARLTVLLTALFPTGFFLLAPYTESVALALTLAALWLARQGRPWAAGLAGLGVGMARVPGLLLTLPLAFEYLRRRRQQGKAPGLGLLAATLPVLGLLGTMLYFRLVVGEQRSIFQVATIWGDRDVPFWESIAHSWGYISGRGSVREGLNLACLLGFSLLALLAARRLPPGYAVYIGPFLVLLFSRETMVSPLSGVSRYVLLLFPCFMMLALGLAHRPRMATAWLLASALFQVYLFQGWVRGVFVA